ncbi:MAG: molybdopterin cofactor-binding domain-containing protein, partial [Actinomycetes bacterium]
EFSRKSFLKGGGALVIGFSAVGAATGAKVAKAYDDPFASMGPYDQGSIDSWLVIHPDNTASVKIGKVEMGQGTPTALLMITAEELDFDMSQVSLITHDTNVTPNQGASVGSQGVQTGGKQTRAAAAAARAVLLNLAASSLGVSVGSLSVSKGVVSGGGKSVKYGDLLGGKLFNAQITGFSTAANTTTPATAVAGAPGTKDVSTYKIVGKSGIPRVDIPDKVNGKYTYVHNIRIPGMLHGRIIRTRGQGAYGDGTSPKIVSVDESSISHIPNAKVIRYGDYFLGVTAPKEYDAIQAAAQLKVTWAAMPAIAPVGNLFSNMRKQDAAGLAPARVTVNLGNVDAGLASAAITVSQAYKYHYTGHLPIGPTCVVADVTSNGTRIYSNTQDAYATRLNVYNVLAPVMGSSAPAINRIRVTYFEGGSVYGSAPYHDAAQAAAIMSAKAGAPVRLQWMRWDEHGWDNYGPAQLTDVRVGADSKGVLTALETTATGIPYWTTMPTQQQVQNGTAVYAATNSVDGAITGTQYTLANRRVIGKSLPLQNNYLKVSFLRAPNAPQTAFAVEQAIDELAYAAKMDPVAFRLLNVQSDTSLTSIQGDPAGRWRNVLTNVAKDAGWVSKVAASKLSSDTVVSGRGVAFGQYSNTMSAAVADVTVNKKTGKITCTSLHMCGDAGLIVYIDGSDNNEEGAAVQGLSRALVEEVTFNKSNVTSLDWVSYPMLRFKDSPKVRIHGLSRTDVPDPAGPGSRTTGSGEPALAPVAAAVANAAFDATGVRFREAPMSPARVRAALKAAGIA